MNLGLACGYIWRRITHPFSNEPILTIEEPSEKTDFTQDKALLACKEKQAAISEFLKQKRVVEARIEAAGSGNNDDGISFISCSVRFADGYTPPKGELFEGMEIGGKIKELTGYSSLPYKIHEPGRAPQRG